MKATINPEKTPTQWDSEALYLKSQRYAQRMLEQDVDNPERGLWSGLMLEFLARAALANVSPALLADERSWQSLYHALGFSPTESRFSPKSITASELFNRLRSIFPTFNQEIESFCVVHTGRRNSELHSGEVAFEGVANSSWSPRFYKASQVLLETMGLQLSDLFGKGEAVVAEKLIAAAADDAAKSVRGDVDAHLKVWQGKEQNERTSLLASAAVWAARHSGHRVKCVACGSPALLFGEPVGIIHQKIANDTITESHEHLPTHFECIACALKILGLSKLTVVGLGDRYKSTYSYDAAEFYAPDDHHPDFEEDNNEP